MLRYKIGDELFWKGAKQYYQEFRDSIATSGDFQAVMEAVSGQNLGQFFQQWLYWPGFPKIRSDWVYDPQKKQLIVSIEQIQNNGNHFQFSLELGIYRENILPPQIEALPISKAKHTFEFDMESRPQSIQLDPNFWVLMEVVIHKK